MSNKFINLTLNNKKVAFSKMHTSETYKGQDIGKSLTLLLSEDEAKDLEAQLKPMMDAGFTKLPLRPHKNKEGELTGDKLLKLKIVPDKSGALPLIVDAAAKPTDEEAVFGQKANLRIFGFTYGPPMGPGISLRVRAVQLHPKPEAKAIEEVSFDPIVEDSGLNI